MTANRRSEASLPTISAVARSTVLAMARWPAASDAVPVSAIADPSPHRSVSAYSSVSSSLPCMSTAPSVRKRIFTSSESDQLEM